MDLGMDIKVDLGTITASPNVNSVSYSNSAFYTEVSQCLYRHQTGDWGIVCSDDAIANNEALDCGHGERIMSAYPTCIGQTLWIITEPLKHSTQIMFASDFAQ